jgi:O-antigen ligase
MQQSIKVIGNLLKELGARLIEHSNGYLLISFRSEKPPSAIIGISIFIVFGALNFGFIKDRVSDAVNISTDPESYNISDSGLIRVGLWRGSLSLATSSPKNFLVGTGPETFPYEFPFYRPDFLNYSSEWAFILNKPHNYYLEILTESGIFALVSYLVIVIKTIFVRRGGMNRFLTAGLVGLFATSVFGWPTVYTSLLFWMWLALLSKKGYKSFK